MTSLPLPLAPHLRDGRRSNLEMRTLPHKRRQQLNAAQRLPAMHGGADGEEVERVSNDKGERHAVGLQEVEVEVEEMGDGELLAVIRAKDGNFSLPPAPLRSWRSTSPKKGCITARAFFAAMR